MIISASRRTDIPAHYGAWFMNRVRQGFCITPNPFNPRQVGRLDLSPENVDAFVFWTKNPAPFLPHLDELDRAGFHYYFLFTLNDYPADLEPGVPPLSERIDTFCRLSQRLRRTRVIWRYDPIIISNRTGFGHHRRAFERLAEDLSGYTFRCIVSILYPYRKTVRRLNRLAASGWRFDFDPWADQGLTGLLADMAGIAATHDMEMMSCAEPRDLTGISILPGCCIDGNLINSLRGENRPWHRDPGQRKHCGCAPSRDLGMNDSCLTNCPYCYATVSEQAAADRFQRHDENSPQMIGYPPVEDSAVQGRLF